MGPLQEFRDAGVAPAGCAACRAATAHVQRASLEAAGAWLCRAVEEEAERDQAWVLKAPALSLCRAEPDCEGLQCEAPMRRGTSMASASRVESWFQPAPASAAGVTLTTPIVQQHVGVATTQAPVPPAALRAAVARFFLTQVPFDAALLPRTGVAAAAALLVANNLVSWYHPGPRCVSVLPATPKNTGALAAATKPSLAVLDQWIGAGAETAEPLTSGDLAAIHLLVRAIDTVCGAERRAPQAVPVAAPPQRGCLGVFLPAKAAPPVAPQPRLPQDPHAEARAKLRSGLAAHDLLGRAGTLFAGTCAEEPPQAAVVLRRLDASDEGYLALTLIVRAAARTATEGGNAERLAEVGQALLDDDDDGRGLHVSSWLLAELVSAFPHPKPPRAEEAFLGEGGSSVGHRGQGSELWRILCGAPGAGSRAPFPRWIARLLRSGQALAAERRPWSRAEGRFFLRLRDAGEALLGGEMLADPSFHLFFVRTFAGLAEEKLDGFELPNCGSFGARELCARLEQIVSAYEESGKDPLRLSMRAEAEAAIKLPGFERTFRAAEWRRQEQTESWQASEPDVLDEYLHGGGGAPGGGEPLDRSPAPLVPPPSRFPPAGEAAALPEPAPDSAQPFVPVKVVRTDNPRRQRRPYKSR